MGVTYVHWSNYLQRLKFCVGNIARDPNIVGSCGLEVNKPAERGKNAAKERTSFILVMFISVQHLCLRWGCVYIFIVIINH